MGMYKTTLEGPKYTFLVLVLLFAFRVLFDSIGVVVVAAASGGGRATRLPAAP